MQTVKNIIENASNWELLAQRQARETLRSVYKVDNTYTVKKFEVPLATRKYRTPWITEYEASERLNGEGTSRVIGFTEKQKGENREIYLVKKFTVGQTIFTFTDDDIPDVASLISSFHNKGILTDDTNVNNFIRSSDGHIRFIDLGRAIIHDRHSLPFYRNVGREFAKFRREGLKWNRKQWASFREHYFKHTRYSPMEKMLINISYRLTMVIRCIRKTIQFKSPWS